MDSSFRTPSPLYQPVQKEAIHTTSTIPRSPAPDRYDSVLCLTPPGHSFTTKNTQPHQTDHTASHFMCTHLVKSKELYLHSLSQDTPLLWTHSLTKEVRGCDPPTSPVHIYKVLHIPLFVKLEMTGFSASTDTPKLYRALL